MVTGYVVDKKGNILSDEDLSKKVIDVKSYYDIVLPIRKKINEQLFRQSTKNVK